MAVRIDISSCNQSPETCPAVRQMFEVDTFYEAVQDVYPGVADGRKVLGDLVIACFNGTCPGQHLEETKAVLRNIIGLNDPEV